MTLSRNTAAVGMILAGLLLAAHPASAAEQAGRALQVQGRVEALRDGKWRAMWSEDPIFVGDRVRTFADGRVQLKFVDQSVVKMAANSQLEITAYLFTATERLGFLKLWTGRLRAVVSKKLAGTKNEYRFATPTAVAGVRGTDLGLAYQAPDPGGPDPDTAPDTELIVFEGIVDFNSADGSKPPVTVTDGQTSRAGQGDAPSEPAPASEKQKKEFETASNARNAGETEYAETLGDSPVQGEGESQGDGPSGPDMPEASQTPAPPPINQIPESRAPEKANADVEVRRVQ